MKNLTLGTKIITVYDSIDEMPIANFQKYNKYLLIDSGIGSDVDSLNDHIQRIAKLINAGNKEFAIKELQNMRQNIAMINSEISPQYLAFTALIHSIDGKKNEDLSDDHLKEVLKEINKVSHSSLLSFLSRFKKKIDLELATYFKEFDDNPMEKEAYDKIKERTLLVLDGIKTEKDNTEKIDKIDEYLFGLYRPNTFVGRNSIEVKYDKNFEASRCTISQRFNGMSTEDMTVLQFFNAIELIKRQIDEERKSLKK